MYINVSYCLPYLPSSLFCSAVLGGDHISFLLELIIWHILGQSWVWKKWVVKFYEKSLKMFCLALLSSHSHIRLSYFLSNKTNNKTRLWCYRKIKMSVFWDIPTAEFQIPKHIPIVTCAASFTSSAILTGLLSWGLLFAFPSCACLTLLSVVSVHSFS